MITPAPHRLEELRSIKKDLLLQIRRNRFGNKIIKVMKLLFK